MLFSSLMLFAGISTLASVSVQGTGSPLQSGDKIIIAKGDIPTPEKYRPAIESYLAFIRTESSDMVSQLEIIKKELKAGELKKAQQAYIQAHQHYEAIRPIVILFGNIDHVINARADYFLDGVKDYRFTGFHLVEYQLFDRKDIKTALNAIDRLLIQSYDLRKRISTQHIEILNLVRSSADFIEEILETQLAGKENVYSFSDINDIAANLRGSKEVVTVLTSFIPKEVLLPILQNYQKIKDILSQYKLNQDEYQSYNQLRAKDKMSLYSILAQQAEFLVVLRRQLDIDVYHKY
ncbi:EfeM/EfeO family lipoprotein [Liberibacter sp. Z1]|nr:EfeM/EfeO family lipoprotein [Candidatus Liberibacter sp.]